MQEIITKRLKESVESKQALLDNQALTGLMSDIAQKMIAALRHGNKIMFCGNGGSAVDAMHLAAELSGRYYFDRKPLNAEALSADNAFLTAVANDYGYEKVFSRLLRAKGNPGDILVGLSTSGNSQNVIHAFEQARKQDIITVGFTGQKSCAMDALSDYLFKAPSIDTPRIQECHMLVGHILCELVEIDFLKDAEIA
jgi:D-sedoheptulose 7-phosphate isomerase